MTLLIVLFALTVLITLTSCSVEIKDHEFCVNKGVLGAHCGHTLTEETRDIGPAEWAELSFGQICTADPPEKFGETFGDIKATIEKLCSKCNCCTYKIKEKLEKFFTQTRSMQEKVLSDSI